jgi:nucleoside-diphosphate-sugar epimerase
MIKNKKVLVTGATGFLGGNLIVELAKNGNRITCLVKPYDNIERLLKSDVNIVYADITKKESLTNAVDGFEYIFHLAGLLGGNNPRTIYNVNYEGIRNLVEACLQNGGNLKRFVFASSAAVIGPTTKDEILDESAPCKPVTDYAKSKLMAEQYLNSLKYDFPITIIRFPVVYGPGSFGGFYNLFKLLNKQIFLDIGYGEMNVCFVQDAVEGMMQAAESENTKGKTYILGERMIYSTVIIKNMVAKALKKCPIRIITPYFLIYAVSILFEIHGKISKQIPALTRNEVSSYLKHRYWRFNPDKAVRDFSFKICYPLEKGLVITADWYKRNGLI